MEPFFEKLFETYVENNQVINPFMHEINQQTSGFIGRCLVSKEKKMFWVNIPKNASNTVSETILHKGWRPNNYILTPDILEYTPIVILRDPIERRIGCILELCYHAFQSPTPPPDDEEEFRQWFVKNSFDQIWDLYEPHFIRQIDYLMGLNLSKIKFFYMSPNLNNELKSFLGYDFNKLNETDANPYKAKIKKVALDLLKDEKYLLELNKFNKADNILCNSVKYLQGEKFTWYLKST